jgi:hypothetical protein
MLSARMVSNKDTIPQTRSANQISAVVGDAERDQPTHGCIPALALGLLGEAICRVSPTKGEG